MPILAYIIFSLLIVSLGSLVGIFTLPLKTKKLDSIIIFLIALSAGTLLGGAFLHLLPEASEKISVPLLLKITLISFIFFFILEKALHWRHCHKQNCTIHAFGYLNLFGDGIHNFIDGLIIASAYLTDIHLGIATTVAVAFHEIPQEIGDFGVLIHSGFTRNKALLANFLVALLAVLGGIVGYLFSSPSHLMTTFLLPFAAGGFIYIATSDLIPIIIKETQTRRVIISFLLFLLGILIMYFFTFLK